MERILLPLSSAASSRVTSTGGLPTGVMGLFDPASYLGFPVSAKVRVGQRLTARSRARTLRG